MVQSEWITPAEAGQRIFGNITGKTVVRKIKSGEIPSLWPQGVPRNEQEEVWQSSGTGARPRYKLNARVCRAIQQYWNEEQRKRFGHIA